MFFYLDSDSISTVVSQNCDYHRRKGGEWHLSSEPNDKGEEDEAWDIQLANELICKTKQLEGVEFVTGEV